jgi:hypothetical protein
VTQNEQGYDVIKLGKRYRFTLVPFDEIRGSSTSKYLVKGIVPRKGLVIIWGPPKCGKSFWVFTVMLHVALDWVYRGHRVQGGDVVYLALEGQDGFGNRADAFRARYLKGEKVPRFHLIKETTDLVRDHKQLVADIYAQCPDSPAAVVIDTMNRSLVGSESKDEDMAAYLRAAKAIEDAFDCVVIIVHHCGVDGTRPRGHTSQGGAVDVELEAQKDKAGNVVVTVKAAKEMVEGAVITSRLEVVELGIDQDGDKITSCVVLPVEDVAPIGKPAKPAKRRKMAKSAQVALRALEEAITELGERAPTSNHIPSGVRVTTLDAWREYAYRRGISPSEKARARQAAFARASEYLTDEQIVGVWDNNVWITGAR